MKIFNFLQREKWAHVYVIEEAAKKENSIGKVYIQLFESNKGNRRVEFSSTFPYLGENSLKQFCKSLEVYNKRVVRWLSGRIDPEIPRYNQIGEEDLSNMLKGQVR